MNPMRSGALRYRPEDPVLFDLAKAVGRCQSTVNGEPSVGVPEVREVESAEAGQRHPCVPDDEIIFGPAAWSADPVDYFR
jgi:hypothetical protein